MRGGVLGPDSCPWRWSLVSRRLRLRFLWGWTEAFGISESNTQGSGNLNMAIKILRGKDLRKQFDGTAFHKRREGNCMAVVCEVRWMAYNDTTSVYNVPFAVS